MKTYLYLSLWPESLIVSMLPPEEFGHYLAVGTKKRMRGEAIFFELDPDFRGEYFNWTDIEERCKPHPNGEPKRTVYVSIYRVLEHVPLDLLKNLYLVTDNGRVLELERQSYQQEDGNTLHLYQEMIPVIPRIASNLNPLEFCRFVTDTKRPVSVPKLAFVELILDDVASDPVAGDAGNLPYPHMEHLRDCLIGLKEHPETKTKTVIRQVRWDILYRTIKNGIFVGDQNTFNYYPFPSREDLEGKHYLWWHSAMDSGMGLR
jgi:hypothetical protein